MITFIHLFPRIASFANLDLACRKAALGKKHQPEVAAFLLRSEPELLRLREELLQGTYRPGRYRTFHLQEYAKKREISAAPFRDRVVHHAFCQVVEPLFDPRFIFHSYACRAGKGTHRAVRCCQKWLRQNRYVFQADIVQYFASIDHRVLLNILAQKMRDARVMKLVELIVHSWRPEEGRGVPIGNLTSQLFANLYLNELDSFVKFRLRRRHYLRYMDDFLLFGDTKEDLWDCERHIRRFLNERLRLSLHQRKTLVYPCESGVPWLGFCVDAHYRRISPANVRRFLRRVKLFKRRYVRGDIPFNELPQAVRRWINHARHGDTYCLRKRLFRSLVLP
jgi:retron-type reverse transcriptase